MYYLMSHKGLLERATKVCKAEIMCYNCLVVISEVKLSGQCLSNKVTLMFVMKWTYPVECLTDGIGQFNKVFLNIELIRFDIQ